MTDALEMSPYVHGLVSRASNAIGGLTAMRPLLPELGAVLEALTSSMGGSSTEPGSRSKGSHSDPTALAAERRQHQKAELAKLARLLTRLEQNADEMRLFMDAYLSTMDPKKARALTACVWHERAGMTETLTHFSDCGGLLPARLHLCSYCIKFRKEMKREPEPDELDRVKRGGRIMRPAS